jgi:glycosyltransferase involved in cell wall biosynthesis
LEPRPTIIFWQPIASPHQEAFLEAVAERCAAAHGVEVILGVERDMPPERSAQGWARPDHKHLKVIDISVPANHAALAGHSTAASLHVFSGFFSHPLVWAGFRRLAPTPARLAIFSEAPEQPWQTGWLKRLRGRLLAARWAHRFAFVLAIGGVGCEFFSRIGFPEEKIVPFGYFLDVPPLAAAASSRPSDGIVRFVSAGQLIHRKGIDLLLRACGDLPTTGWRLDCYGDGPERPRLEQVIRSLGLSDRVAFHGVVSSQDVRERLAKADVAVLPSRFDGWGTLVNESLAAGTPVICTAACGAAGLVSSARLGSVVQANSAAALSAALSHAIARGPVLIQDRAGIHADASTQMSATWAAARFESLLTGAGLPLASLARVES